ncbi:MAG: MDR family MFS transporter [Planctomycetota bacterium]
MPSTLRDRLARAFGRYDRRLWILTFGRAITSLGHGVSFPFLAIYFTSVLDVPFTQVGAVISVGALAGGVSKFIGGSLSDRVGRKGVMLVAVAGRAVTTLGIGLLALQDRPSWMLVAGLFILGSTFMRVFEPASQAMIADVSDEKSRTAAYGLLRVGTNLGWAVGVMAGGLIGKESYAAMFLTTAAVVCVAFFLLLAYITETAPARVRPREQQEEEDPPPRGLQARITELAVPGFFLLCWIGILVHIVQAQLVMPLSVFSKEFLWLTEDQIGLLFFLNGLMVAVLQFPASRWAERRCRLTTSLVIGGLLFAAGYGLCGLALGFWTMVGCTALFTLGEILVVPGTITLAANLAPAARRGLFLGAFGLVTMAGRFAGPLMGGMNLERFADAPWIHWAIIGGFCLAAAAGSAVLRFRIVPEADLAQGEAPLPPLRPVK